MISKPPTLKHIPLLKEYYTSKVKGEGKLANMNVKVLHKTLAGDDELLEGERPKSW